MLKKDIDTPAVLIDLERMKVNIQRMQAEMDAIDVKLRPHVKTHKTSAIAHMQIEAGAVGITVAKLGEAEVMAEAGIDDIFVAYEIVGERKLERLLALSEKVRISVAVDSLEVALPLSKTFEGAATRCEVLIEVDTGLGRCGVVPGEPLLNLAAKIAPLPGLKLAGLFTHEGFLHRARNLQELAAQAQKVGKTMVEAAQSLRQRGHDLQVVSVGATPARTYTTSVAGITENRPGTYVFNDRAQLGLGSASREDCALTVLATVISRPAPDRAVIDAGRKILSSDRDEFLEGFGEVVGRPNLLLEWMNEEHGIIRTEKPGPEPKVGELLEIIPNHVCMVMNMVDRVYVLRGERVVDTWPVVARGKSQ